MATADVQELVEINNPLSVISTLITRDAVDPLKLEKMLELQERWERNEAKKLFASAMSDSQAEMPRLIADSKNTQTNSKYAKLEAVNDSVVPVYVKHGFSLSFGTDDSPLPNHIRVVCDVRHRGGHESRYQVDAPVDINGIKGNANKTDMWAMGSTLSYARRYLTLLIFNITVASEDNDGQTGARITHDQFTEIETLLRDAKAMKSDVQRLLAWLNIGSLAEVPARRFEDFKHRIEIIAERNAK